MTQFRRLDAPITAYRIGGPAGEHKIWDAGSVVIYASRTYSTAILEKLVHYSGEIPPNQHFIEITIPSEISYEVVNPDLIEGWSRPDGEPARKHGRAWFAEKRSAILLVPSVVARLEQNIAFNTIHEEFDRIKIGLEIPIWWDCLNALTGSHLPSF